jgi:hypothetical protein
MYAIYTCPIYRVVIRRTKFAVITEYFIIFIISMTKLLDADWLRGVQLFY